MASWWPRIIQNKVIFLVCLFCSSILGHCSASTAAVITPNSSLRDEQGDTLVSVNKKFELGFFSPAGSTGRYLGIWYVNISPQTVVWVANREFPLSNTTGALRITSQGVLVLTDHGTNNNKTVLWSSNASTTAQEPVAELLDSGNLVVRNGNGASSPDEFLWQSFDYPCDTFLPGMKIRFDFVTGFEAFVSSWKSVGDPSPGPFSLHIDPRGYPQMVIRKGTLIQYRAGSWNGLSWTGTPLLNPNPTITPAFVLSDSEVYCSFELQNFPPTRYTLSSSGVTQRFLWNDKSNNWLLGSTKPSDQCDNYALCGANAICDLNNSPACVCLDGFTPMSPREWNLNNWSDGCVRRTSLGCQNNDAFQKHSGIKLPDTSSSWYNKTMGLMECEALCKKNCSCTAYASLDVRAGGSGCLIWYTDHLVDIKRLSEGGQDLYIRLAASELDNIEIENPNSKKKQRAIIATCAILSSTLVGGILIYLRRRNLRKHDNAKDLGGEEDMELPIFDLTSITNATNHFSTTNKLGEGGFGPVYKGTLINGQEIAVKRLSKSSSQGLNEFKTEITLIAKLQHRNLVKLLGCCFHQDEKMLIYEYMPNKSLDFFIFDEARSKLLDWQKRFHIVDGIARGLLYLHQDSRLRIIHRDLKTSNILLDNDMNPKISDFGLAKTFGGDQIEASTKKVVGTYGYMSPEYLLNGHFSVKSDVYSFGVLVLEIVSGKKNRGFCHPDHYHNLLGHAWMLWNKETPLQLIDDKLNDLCTLSKVSRCIQVALLCVQQRPQDRPNMSTVVFMLGSEIPLPQPKKPGFYMAPDAESSPIEHECYSPNKASISLLEPR